MTLDLRSRFGLHATPFTPEIGVEQHFTLPFFDEALTGLRRAVDERMSAALIAPAGTGKTALLRALVSRLSDARFRVHYVKVTGLSKRDMCREIAVACGAEPAGTYPTLVRRLQEHFMAASDTDGLRPVLLLDEAHDLRIEVLGMVRLLTNFDMDSRLVVSVILAGQKPLAKLLGRDDLEDIARRLAHIASLRVLSRDETVRYVQHRLTVAGASQIPFDAGAQDALYEIGRGNLRATDRLAFKALELAHDGNSDVASTSHVVEARRRVFPS